MDSANFCPACKKIKGECGCLKGAGMCYVDKYYDELGVWKREPVKLEHLVPTKWGWMVSCPENCFIHGSVDIGAFTYINAWYGVEIREGVQIGSHCSIYSENTINGTKGKVVIGKGSTIGSHSVVLPGVVIGENEHYRAFSLIK